MTKSKKAVMVTVRMTELQVSELDYIRQPGETRSAAIRRLVDIANARQEKHLLNVGAFCFGTISFYDLA